MTTTPDKNYIFSKYETIEECWFGRIMDNDVLYLECGRQQQLSVAKDKKTRILAHQVTIRDIKIAKAYRKLGLFTEFIRRLLTEKQLVVSLESVQPDWLKARLDKSPLWVLQTPEMYKDQNPVYSRFPSDEHDKNFSLF